ncbi:MAG: hypothetical protein ACFB9M_14210 [Myxococcota bacterium]
MLALASRETAASPWALPAERLVLTGAVRFQWAGQEFLDARRPTPIPLNGFFTSTTFEVGGRWGLGSGFDVELLIPIAVLNFASDSVILLDQPPDSTVAPLDFFQNNVLGFGQTPAGVSDIRVTGRKQWLARPFALATLVELKIPAGYDGPVGTFGPEPTTAEEFIADLETIIVPENVADDVALGDGQVDVTPSLHLGWASSKGLFLRSAVGYAFRFGGAADEFRAETRVGQLFLRRFLVFASAFVRVAVEDGRNIGISVAAVDPELPAADFGGLTNLLLRELQLERDLLDVGGGLIYRISERYELNATYERIVWGRNTSAINSVSLSVAGRIDL